MDIDSEKLAHASKSAEAMPEKGPRSYLAPAETLILELLAKGYTFRAIQKWLAENLGVSPSLSNLHYFAGQAKRRRARKKGVTGPSLMPVQSEQTLALQQSLTSGTAASATDDDQKAKNAVRALKAKAKTPTGNKGSAVYVFDISKPLTIKSQPKKG